MMTNFFSLWLLGLVLNEKLHERMYYTLLNFDFFSAYVVHTAYYMHVCNMNEWVYSKSFMENNKISGCSLPQKFLNWLPPECGLLEWILHYYINNCINLVHHGQFISLLLLSEVPNICITIFCFSECLRPIWEPNEFKYTIQLYF